MAAGLVASLPRGAVALMWTVAVSLIIYLTASSGCQASSLPVSEGRECEAFTSQTIEDCLAEGGKFITTYIKRQLERRKGKKGKQYDQCRSYQKFEDCIKPIINECQQVKHELSHHWQPIIDMMTSACSQDNAVSNERLECLQQEYDSIFSYQCDTYYDFNIAQGTRHICHFVHERVHCKEALIASACGPEVGLFSFHLLKLHSDQELADMGIANCHVTKDANYGGLRYDTQNCPRDMVARIDECSNTHLTDDKIVDFREESEIIVLKEDRKKLEKACSSIEEYKKCISPTQEACPHGAKVIFDYAEHLKKYLLKMDLICQPSVLEVYQKKVKCMNSEVLDSQSLAQCDHLWKNVAKAKTNLTAFHFYCDESHQGARALMIELGNLRSCYKTVFEEKCSLTGELIEKLLRKVFQDPVYLRFNFEPDCQLHRTDTDATMNDGVVPRDPDIRVPTPWVTAADDSTGHSKSPPQRAPSTGRPRPSGGKDTLKPGTREERGGGKPLPVSSHGSRRTTTTNTMSVITAVICLWLLLTTQPA